MWKTLNSNLSRSWAFTWQTRKKNASVIGELHRRIGFEFNGMRNHEYYFKSLEGGAKPLPKDSKFRMAIEKAAGLTGCSYGRVQNSGYDKGGGLGSALLG